MARQSHHAPPPGFVGSLLRDVSGLWGAEGAALAAFLVQGILVARWIGPRGLGIATLVVGYPAFLLTFFDLRAGDTAIKYLGEFHAQGRREQALAVCHFGYAADVVAAGATLAVVGLTGAWAEGHVLHSPGTFGLLVMYALAQVARSPAGTSRSVLAVFGRFRELAVAQTINAWLRAAVILALVASGWGVAGVVLGSALALPADAALTYTLARGVRREGWGVGSFRGSWHALAGRRREIAAFTAWADLGSVFGLVAKQTDVLILGWFWGPAVVGYYSLAESISGFAGNVVSPLQSVVYPRLARLWGSGDIGGLWAEVRNLARRVGVPLAAAGLLSLPFVPLGVRWTVGPRYLAAVPAARILIVAGLVWLGLFWVRPLLLTTGSVRWLAVVSGGGGAATVVGMMLLAPGLGAAGVAWAQLIVVAGVHAICLGHIARSRRGALTPVVAA